MTGEESRSRMRPISSDNSFQVNKEGENGPTFELFL